MSASAYPPAHSLPAYIPTASVAANLQGDDSFVMIERATVAELRTAIELQQADVRKAASGLPELCNLLNRRLMEGAADTDPAMTGLGNPVFDHEVYKQVCETRAAFDKAMKDFDFDAAITRALVLADRAFQDHQVETDGKANWIRIALDQRHGPLIQALASRSIGRIDLLDFAFHIEFRDLFGSRKKRRADCPAAVKALEAFALELSKPGFQFDVILDEYE